ncbi:MAG: hypothetical protein EON58_00315 [Alphaproteobacteria bacterium]|nr:MAG: hypothetical protein EON58_00315 [Alphaproteobacteria bacterium]
MALIVTLTGGFGLLASFTMLQLGMDWMTLRYPLALSFAYLFFLFLIWLWLRTNAEDYLDLEAPDIPGISPCPKSSECLSEFKSDGGGDFGGGGASASFDGHGNAIDDTMSSPLKSVSDSVSSVVEAEEQQAIPLLALALALGIALASLYVVYIAPALFAEVLVDGALSYALFRHLRGQDPRHWLSSTARHTAVPFTATAIFLVAAGAAMTAYAPGAKSVGQVIDHAAQQRVSKPIPG